MALAIVDGRAGVGVGLEFLVLAQIDLAEMGAVFLAKVVDNGMVGGSVSVATDGEIRILRAHALGDTCRYGWVVLLGWVRLCRND